MISIFKFYQNTSKESRSVPKMITFTELIRIFKLYQNKENRGVPKMITFTAFVSLA